jgi:hypothetical protein
VPLWQDVREAAERQLASQSNVAHFLGAIVIELTSAEPGRVKTYSVIDGQQRLTTLQLLLAAFRDEVAGRDASRAPDIADMLVNTGRHAKGALVFKVWPSEHDRGPFREVVKRSDEAATEESEQPIPNAYSFFRKRIATWLDDDPDQEEQRLDALQDTCDGLVQLVAIQLDESSDAQVIFETLNSRGADLTSLDLVKNSLLRQAGRDDGADVGELHAQHWQPALGDADYWFETVRQGRYTNERADLFLMHWLTMKTGQSPRVQHLFAAFRKNYLQPRDDGLPQPSAKELIIELSRDAKTYHDFDKFEPTSIEGRFFRRLEAMDTTTLIPVALLLFSTQELSPDRRRVALRALESWLVRRMLLGSTSAHYNRLLARLLGGLKDLPSLSQADTAIIETLRKYERDTDVWPTDDAVRRRLKHDPLYGWINQRRIRMLLEACEEGIVRSGGGKTEGILVPEGLSIEHALPQEWKANWELPPGIDEEDATIERDKRVHVTGNLTLVTSRLNSSLSNAAWPKKRGELKNRSQLLVNQRLCDHEEWNEKLIDERSAELAGYVLDTWPGPDSPTWTVALDSSESVALPPPPSAAGS